MELDEEELELLRMCAAAAGPLSFGPEANTKKAHLAFNIMGNRLMGLRERGLLDFPDGNVIRYRQGGGGKYSRILVNAVTAAGREILSRHELPGEQIVQVVRQKVTQLLVARTEAFAALRRDMSVNITAYSGTPYERLRRAVSEEYIIRAEMVLGCWRQVIMGRNLAFTRALSALIGANVPIWNGSWRSSGPAQLPNHRRSWIT